MRTTDVQNISWHWDFAARNILIQGREGSEAGSTQSTVTCKHSARMSVDDSSPNGHKHNVQVTFEHCTGGNCKHTVKVAVDDASGKTYQHTLEITDAQNSSNKSQNEITADGDKVVAKSGEKANAALKLAAEWAITGVLDLDDVLSVPLVLARKPPAWLWFNEEERNTWDGNNDANPYRDLTEDELLIKAHFDQSMARADRTYMEDPTTVAFGLEHWLDSVSTALEMARGRDARFLFGSGISTMVRWSQSV